MTKMTLSLLAAAWISSAGVARNGSGFSYNSDQRFPRSNGFVQAQASGRPALPPPPPRLSDTQRQAFEACLSQYGVSAPPPPPELTAAQQSAIQGCQSQSGSREAMRSCLQSTGVQVPPPPPEPSARERQVLESCLQQAQSGR